MSRFSCIIIDTIVNESQLEPFIAGAPPYAQQMARTVVRVIRSIHGLPRLHGDDLATYEVYIGRAGATPQHVLNRFREHQVNKGHPYGAVLFRCPTSRAPDMESLAIVILDRLRERKQLCVANANVARTGNGALPATRESVVYMTWRRGCTPSGYTKPLSPDIREIAADVARAFGLDKGSLHNALMGLKRPTTELSVPDFALM